MTERSKYLILIKMDADPKDETRFNEWYDKEHIPALQEIPDVKVYRYKITEGAPKYLTVLEVEDLNFISSEAGKKAAEKTGIQTTGIALKNTSMSKYERIYPKD